MTKDQKTQINYVYRGEGTSFGQRLAWNVGQVFSRVLSMVLFRLTVRGLQHIPKTGPVLMVTNHQSFLDPWLIAIAPSRQFHFMARDSLFKNKAFGWIISLLNAYPVRRGAADLTSIRMTIERLEQGRLVNIFPEGTRSTDGSIGKVAPGLTLIVNRCKIDVPIVPAVIDGAFEAWPRNKKFPRPKKIRIVYGEPIQPATYRAMKPDELAEHIRNTFIALQGQLRGQ